MEGLEIEQVSSNNVSSTKRQKKAFRCDKGKGNPTGLPTNGNADDKQETKQH